MWTSNLSTAAATRASSAALARSSAACGGPTPVLAAAELTATAASASELTATHGAPPASELELTASDGGLKVPGSVGRLGRLGNSTMMLSSSESVRLGPRPQVAPGGVVGTSVGDDGSSDVGSGGLASVSSGITVDGDGDALNGGAVTFVCSDDVGDDGDAIGDDDDDDDDGGLERVMATEEEES